MNQQQTVLEFIEKLEDYFPSQATQCFRPHCRPNKQMFEQLSIIVLQTIDSKDFIDCKSGNYNKVQDPLEFPYSAIGLLSLKYGQKNYCGSGFLVGPNVVLTAARNLYIHSLQRECEQVKFYPGLHSLNGREFYVKKFCYPPQYKYGEPDKRKEFDFAILELEDNAGLQYGYFGVDLGIKNQKLIGDDVHIYGYSGCLYRNNNQLYVGHQMYGYSGEWTMESDNRLKYRIPASAGQFGCPIYIKKASNSYSVIGIHTDGDQAFNSGVLLNNNIRVRINEWIKKLIKTVQLRRNNIKQNNGEIKQRQFKEIIKKIQKAQINEVSLKNNSIGIQGANFLGRAQWPSLSIIDLRHNDIGTQGAKFISQANWPSLTYIDLNSNKISTQGVKFLSQAHWPSLTYINLRYNNIGRYGAKFLSQAHWPSLTNINLRQTDIGIQGAKCISQANWPCLTYIYLGYNNIGTYGVKFLSQAHWPSLATINLWYNNIGTQGGKFLSQAHWPSLITIDLKYNNIGTQGTKFLQSVQWSANPNFYFML